ncbi:replicative DNA helicase [Orbus hercynius]|uniref:DNA 5'-3' helicase n=1 Tax=Orbus hercynius TaxID=593135 RepID=A0A495RID5_9GAMM|nr:DnaB-like helicase C-terminal domain-containing protein [Orbus hercynius]RKS87303.1 replicative DNA helicase [Orbus hercynius]
MSVQQLEGSVIGGLLLNGANQNSFDVLNIVNESMFTVGLYRNLFKEIKQQALSKNIIDPVILSGKLTGQDSANMFESMKMCHSPANIIGYARMMKEDYQARKISQLIKKANNDINSSANADITKDIVKDLIKEFEMINTSSEELEPIHINDVLGSMFETLENRMNGIEKVINFSIPDLDKKIGGLEPSDYIILAARPSMGKTELALEAIKQMAMKGHGVLVFSLEMSASQLAQRQVASTGNIASGKFRNPADLEESDWGKISAGIGQMMNLPIWMVDISDLTIEKIRNVARRHKQKHPELAAIFIDYLGLIKLPKAERNDIAVGIVSSEIKSMAKELKTPVIALSQLSRKVEERPNKRPMNSDLRNSGDIEQDADLTIFIYRDEYYNKENSTQKGIAELIIGKARNGETGTVYMEFRNGHFYNTDQARASEIANSKSVNQNAKKAVF